jgi:hypothetical protein
VARSLEHRRGIAATSARRRAGDPDGGVLRRGLGLDGVEAARKALRSWDEALDALSFATSRPGLETGSTERYRLQQRCGTSPTTRPARPETLRGPRPPSDGMTGRLLRPR